MCLEFFKLPLGHLQNLSFLAHCRGRRGIPPQLFFGNWNEWSCLLGKMPRLGVSMGKFFIRNAVLGVPRWKNPQVFPHEVLCLYVVAEMFLKMALYLETYSVVKTGCAPGWPAWVADQGDVWVLDQLEHSLFQWFHTLRSLCSKAYFSFTWHVENFIHKFTSIQTQMEIFMCYQSEK